MGLYWTYTFFSKPGCRGVVLSNDGSDPSILKNRDAITGLCDKAEFVAKFGDVISDNDVTNESYIVEDYFDTYGGSCKAVIRFSRY